MAKEENNVKKEYSEEQMKFFQAEQFAALKNPFKEIFTEHLPKQIVLIAIIVVLIIFLFLNLNAVGEFIGRVIEILIPIIIGLVFAFMMSSLYDLLVRRFGKAKSKLIMKYSRALATIICTVALIGLSTGLVYLFVPQLYNSIMSFLRRSDKYLELIKTGAEDLKANSNSDLSKQLLMQLEKSVTDLANNASNGVDYNKFFTGLYNGFYLSLKAIINIFIGIVVMIYSLNMKEEFAMTLKRTLFALVRKDIAYRVLEEVRFAKNVFSSFFVGKLLDSLIIGILCYICCLLMGMPYTPLISLIVGITNIIPFFGPFIGAIPSFLLIILEEPFSFRPYVFLIFILILQQVDGNIIGPKILGDRTGVGSFWVLFSILLFGGLFGFVGMIVAVPVWAVITRLFNEYITSRLIKKGYPVTSDEYRNLKAYNISLHSGMDKN